MTNDVGAVDRGVGLLLAESEYLSAPDLARDVARFLDGLAEQAAALGERLLRGASRVLLVGSGGSAASLHTAQFVLDGLSPVPVQVVTGKDLLWRRSAALGPGTLVVFASFSGRTADVVEALDVVLASGSATLAITANPESELALRCADRLTYRGAAIYEVPILILIALFSRDSRTVSVADLTASMSALPGVLDEVCASAVEQMWELSAATATADHMYITGAGPLSSLAFKLAPVLMENVRIGAGFYDAAETRHGPLEFLDRHQPLMLGLLGTDSSRELAAGVLRFWRDRGGQVVVLDAADHPRVHPLLTPIVLNPVTQWFVAWSAHRRGIDDLDERVYMGKGLFSAGSWP